MCYAFTNLGHRILADRKEWKYGEPVGIKVPAGHNLTQDQISLLHAYHYLGATIELDGDLPPLDLATEYSYTDASAALVGKLPGGTEPQRVVEDCPDWLDGLDEDALQYSAVCPDYDKNEFDEDGIQLTAQGRRDRRELEMEELESGRYDYMAVDPAGNVYPTPRSSLGVSLGAAVSGARSSALSTPVATSASPAMTTSGYSSASSSAPFISDSELYRGSRPSRRSWEWSNTNRRGQEPPTEQRWANLPSFEPAPSNQQVGQYHPLPTRGVRHSASTPQLSTNALSRHRHPYRRPPPPTRISAAIPARTQQNILRDPRTGSVRTAQVLEVDFERLGLPAHEPRPRRRQQRGGAPAPYGRAPAPSPGPAAGYASYQEVEREEFRYQGSNQGHRGSQQEPPWSRRSEYNPTFQYSAAGPSYAPPDSRLRLLRGSHLKTWRKNPCPDGVSQLHLLLALHLLRSRRLQSRSLPCRSAHNRSDCVGCCASHPRNDAVGTSISTNSACQDACHGCSDARTPGHGDIVSATSWPSLPLLNSVLLPPPRRPRKSPLLLLHLE